MRVKPIKRLTMILMLLPFVMEAYSQTYSLKVGETQRLNVPSVYLGYVDKAIWACSNPAIQFVSKSSISAEITVLKPFDGYATIELLYVEKYADYKGNTRANTYTKNYYVTCNGETHNGSTSTAATSISVTPEIKVAVGERGKIYYKLYPEGSTAEIWTKREPDNHYFGGITHYDENGYLMGYASSPGIQNVILYFYNENEETVSSTCKVTVYDPTWTDPQSVSLQNVLLLTVGETTKLLPLYTPSSATTLCEWSSDNSSVAKISDGSINAKGIGTATMTLTIQNGLTSQCTVFVLEKEKIVPGLNVALTRAAEILKAAEINNIK